MSSIARLENNRGDCGSCLLSEWDEKKSELYCRIDQKSLPSSHDARTDCPLIDIITCKDCNRSGTDGENTFCMWLGALRKPTDFCSYGERRDDEHTD